VHYIPVKADLSNLISQIEWLQANDDEAAKIAANGNDLYEVLYTFENMQRDSIEVFKRYA
jgi:hypothetical protein